MKASFYFPPFAFYSYLHSVSIYGFLNSVGKYRYIIVETFVFTEFSFSFLFQIKKGATPWVITAKWSTTIVEKWYIHLIDKSMNWARVSWAGVTYLKVVLCSWMQNLKINYDEDYRIKTLKLLASGPPPAAHARPSGLKRHSRGKRHSRREEASKEGNFSKNLFLIFRNFKVLYFCIHPWVMGSP